MRLAWFTPLRPVTSGIADYSADVLPALGLTHDIDVFVASPAERQWTAPSGVTVLDAHDFPWRQHRQPYDLIVYQVGNAACHDYMWPYVFHDPGLVILHDAHLHHARGWSLLRRGRQADYRAEFTWSHPEAPPDAAEVGIAGYSGAIYYCWPMVRAVVTSARMVAVHNGAIARELEERYPAQQVEVVRLGVGDPLVGPSGRPVDRAALGASVRARHGIAPDALIVAAYGGVNPEKRIGPLLGAVAATVRFRPDLHVLLVGQQAAHYDAMADATAMGIGDRVTLTGFVADEDLPAYLAAADVAVCLRWPTAQETSGVWLRCAAAGLPTITTDLVHRVPLPAIDPRSWTVAHVSPTLEVPKPVSVAIDILDEDHSLRLALWRLVTDAAQRLQLGRNARAHWKAGHTIAHMAADYERVLGAAARRRAPSVELPAHLRPDPMAHTRAILAPFGVDPGLDPS